MPNVSLTDCDREPIHLLGAILAEFTTEFGELFVCSLCVRLGGGVCLDEHFFFGWKNKKMGNGGVRHLVVGRRL